MKTTLVCKLRAAQRGTGKDAVTLDFVNARAYSIAAGANPVDAKPVQAFQFTLDGVKWVERATKLVSARQDVVFEADIDDASVHASMVKDPATMISRPKTDFGLPVSDAVVRLTKLVGFVDWKTSAAEKTVEDELDAIFATP